MPRPSPGRARRARRLVGLALVLLVPLASACQSSAEPSAAPERLSRSDAQATLASNPFRPRRLGIHRVHGSATGRPAQGRAPAGRCSSSTGGGRRAYLGGTYPR